MHYISNFSPEEQKEDQNISQSLIHSLSQAEINELKQQAREFHRHLTAFNQELQNPEINYFYLLSCQWLEAWKSYVDYENIINGRTPDFNHFGKNKPGAINDGLFVKNVRLLLNQNTFHPANSLLRDGLILGTDFIFITESAWQWLNQNGYTGKAIVRPSYSLENGTREIEAYLRKVMV